MREIILVLSVASVVLGGVTMAWFITQPAAACRGCENPESPAMTGVWER